MTEQVDNSSVESAEPATEPSAAPEAQTAEAAPVPAPKPIRVAWLAGADTFGRIGRILQPLAVGLMDELVGLTLFIPERSDERELPNVPGEVLRYSRLHWLMFQTRALVAMADRIEARQIQLIHALDAGSADLAARLAGLTGLNHVVSSYSIGDYKRLGTLDERGMAVLAACEPIRRELVERQVAPAQKVHRVRPGVHMVTHATCFTDVAKSITIVACGRIDDFAAYEALLKAFCEVRNRNFDSAFFIIGNGKVEERVRMAAEQMSLSSRLTFVDRQPALQLQGILKSADIYISPAPSDQVDVASLLAMAAGDPVLAARSAANEFLIDGKTALLFNSGNAAELTGRLVGLLEDRAAATVLAESALAYLRENHSPAKMVAALTAIYRQWAGTPHLSTAGAR